jgi:hypothetical protein
MNLISVTRLRVRKARYLPAFAWYTTLAYFQARRAGGNVARIARREHGLVFWTITVWHSEESMRAYRNGGAHRKAMPHLADWCDEGTYVHWTQESPEPPDLPTAHQRLVDEGTVSRVKFPSPDHATKNFPVPEE